jgi:hypothetical protein
MNLEQFIKKSLQTADAEMPTASGNRKIARTIFQQRVSDESAKWILIE